MYTYSTLKEGDYFGEMALMLNEMRHANCIAQGTVRCLTLDRIRFDVLLGSVQELLIKRMRIRILQSVPILSKLSENKLIKLASVMRVQAFDDGQYIIREGEEGTRFYIINEGEVICTRSTTTTPPPTTTSNTTSPVPPGEEELMRLYPQEFFGERALITNEERKANVIACGNVECLVLERSAFESLLSEIQEDLVQEITRRESSAHQAAETASLEFTPTTIATTYHFNDFTQMRTIGTGMYYLYILYTILCIHSLIISHVYFVCIIYISYHIHPYVHYYPTHHYIIYTYICTTLLYTLHTLHIYTGTFGRVKLVVHTPTNTVAAMKFMNKSEVVESHQEKNVLAEKNLLFECSYCTFILQLMQTFNFPNQIVMVMEFVQGGV